jgi:lipopolysaccharide biosynthesis glycosyltransferase
VHNARINGGYDRDSRTDRAVTCAADADYFVPLKVMLRSLRSQSPGLPVFIFDCGLTRSQRRDLAALGASLVQPKPLPGRTWGHVSAATYARFCSGMLPVRRAVYLDADILVTAPLEPLFEIDTPLGFCPESGRTVASQFSDPAPLRHYGIDPAAPAFNDGVMLIDVEYWRGRLYDEYLTKIRLWSECFAFGSQSCSHLIAYEHGDFSFLPKRWNVFPYELADYPDTAVLHFHTASKPWQKGYPDNAACRQWKRVAGGDYAGYAFLQAAPVRVPASVVRQHGELVELLLVQSSETVVCSPGALAVWSLCDGTRNLMEIVNHLKESFPESRDDIEDDVRDAVERLVRVGAIKLPG